MFCVISKQGGEGVAFCERGGLVRDECGCEILLGKWAVLEGSR